ncbi:MAG: response regulator transcription factor [Bacteroidetes bacterium]|nr:response regulator transcription factor [Bacteroidota bacterium]
MKILIADDHAIVRKVIRQIISEFYADAEIEEVSNCFDLIQSARLQKFDIIISDLSMPGKNGLETIKDLRAEGIDTPILILSMHPEDQYALRVLKAGGSGYLTKESAPEELVKAINHILSGKKYISESVAEQLLFQIEDKHERPLHERLSDREFTVFKMIATGKTVGEIAEELHLSVPTISTYRARIIEKTHLKSNSEITRYALMQGIV